MMICVTVGRRCPGIVTAVWCWRGWWSWTKKLEECFILVFYSIIQIMCCSCQFISVTAVHLGKYTFYFPRYCPWKSFQWIKWRTKVIHTLLARIL